MGVYCCEFDWVFELKEFVVAFEFWEAFHCEVVFLDRVVELVVPEYLAAFVFFKFTFKIGE